MKIWHQSLTDLSLLPDYESGLRSHFAAVAVSGLEVEVHGVKAGTYPERYPGTRIGQVYLRGLHREQFVSAGLRAEEEGYDALVIATISDLGLPECRSILDIPVIGLGEASLHVAALLGGAAAVISFGTDVSDFEMRLRRNADSYALGGVLGPILPLGIGFDGVVAALGGDTQPVREAFERAAEKAIQLGARVIIPGAGPLNLAIAQLGITRVGEVPVVDSLRVSMDLSAMMARLRRDGCYVTRKGFYWAQPSKAEVAAARAVYGL